MENLFIFLISFVIIFLIFLVNYFIKRKKKELANAKEIQMLIAKYRLNSKKLNYEALALTLALIYSLLIAFVGTLVSALPMKQIWQLAIGFILIMSLLYITYMLIGLVLKKSENKK